MHMAYINGKYRQALHLEPPCGWLNDPNGLSFFGGYYHVYFQYAPDHADGSGRKCWGHYRSTDMLNWEFTGTVLFPDIPEDKDGVYSGCAVVSGNLLHIFYTGNVKEDGDHDYIRSGRGANVIHVTTADGIHMSKKEVLLRNSDYPAFCSCHVRDPKVWFENGSWKMVLGARTLDDEGYVLFYTSDDLTDWRYLGTESVPGFGYMWECPDVFHIDGHQYLSVSPQGLAHGDTNYQNVYQSGYFHYDGGLKNFTEWDMGFDFYAPQTFNAPDGRLVLIGWMGIGDIPYRNPTVFLGYQHCLTIPREISVDGDGTLLQNPVRELCSLRKERVFVNDGESLATALPFEFKAKVHGSFQVALGSFLVLNWNGKLFELRFTDEKYGGGRTVRKAILDKCSDLRLIADKSSVEVYLDGGRIALSSRMYPESDQVTLSPEGISGDVFRLDKMEVTYLGE